MMNEGADFLQAIRNAPDDDDVRLVYADWLTSHGDPYGEFILVDVELAQRLGPRWVADAAQGLVDWDEEDEAKLAHAAMLFRRREALFDQHITRWTANPDFARLKRYAQTTFAFRRGFLQRVVINQNFGLLKQIAESVAAGTMLPLEGIELWGESEEAVVALLAAANDSASGFRTLLRGLRELAIIRSSTSKAFSRETLVELVRACPGLVKLRISGAGPTTLDATVVSAAASTTLTELDLSSNYFSNALLQDILALPLMKQLRSLNVSFNQLQDNIAASLLDRALLPSLNHLAIASTNLEGAAFDRVTTTNVATQLSSIDLRYNTKVTPESYASLFTHKELAASLEVVLTYGGGFTDSLCSLVARSLPKLKQLDLGQEQVLTAKGLEGFANALATSPAASCFERLEIGSIPELSGAFFEPLLTEVPKLRSLTLTRYHGTKPHSSAPLQVFASAAATATSGRGLRALKLDRWDLHRDPDVAMLVNAKALRGLRSLRLNGCLLGTGGVRAIVESSRSSQLMHLDLGNNAIGDQSVSMIADAYAQHKAALQLLTHVQTGHTYSEQTQQHAVASLGAVLHDPAVSKKTHQSPNALIVIVFPSGPTKLTGDDLSRAILSAVRSTSSSRSSSSSTSGLRGGLEIGTGPMGTADSITVSSRSLHPHCGPIEISVTQKRAKASNRRSGPADVAACLAARKDAASIALAESVRQYPRRVDIGYYLADKYELTPLLLTITKALSNLTGGVAYDVETCELL